MPRTIKSVLEAANRRRKTERGRKDKSPEFVDSDRLVAVGFIHFAIVKDS